MKSKKKKVVKKSFNTLVSKHETETFNKKFKKKIHLYFIGLWNPQFKVVLAYLIFALIGAILLNFSVSENAPNAKEFGFDDALFTSVSAFSNTGLIVGTTSETFNIFGQIVIYILIQVGGFGLLSTFFLIGKSFNKIFLKGKEFKSILGHTEKGQTKISSSFRILIVIFSLIVAFQLLATFILWPIFYLHDFNIIYEGLTYIDNGVGYQDLGLSFWNALFTVGSAINNAGFDLFSQASGGSLGTFFGSSGIAVQIIVLSLFVFGGIGYMVVYDVWRRTTFFIYRKHPKLYRKLVNAKLTDDFNLKPRISIYTKIALFGNIIVVAVSLIFAYTVIWISHETFNGNVSSLVPGESEIPSWLEIKQTGILKFRDDDGAFQEIDTGITYKNWEINFAIFFNTMSTRSAGFSTIDMTVMTDATKWLFSILMIIGTSPSSTGGGVRVTTFVVIIAMVWQKIRGIEHSRIFKKQIALKTKIDASITLILAISLVVLGTFFVTLFDSKINFTSAFFTTASAFGTTGLTALPTGAMQSVSFAALIPIMIIGQLGIANTLETFNIGRNKYTKTESETVYFRVG